MSPVAVSATDSWHEADVKPLYVSLLTVIMHTQIRIQIALLSLYMHNEIQRAASSYVVETEYKSKA